jgi:hypothetical protein
MRETGNIYNLDQSILRTNQLKETVPFLTGTKTIPDKTTVQQQTAERKQRMLDVLGGTDQDWANWKWQQLELLS